MSSALASLLSKEKRGKLAGFLITDTFVQYLSRIMSLLLLMEVHRYSVHSLFNGAISAV